MKVLRKASEIEKDYIDDNMSIYVRFGITGFFSLSEIQEAIQKLTRKHPFLCSIIKNDTFIEQSSFDPILHIETVSFIPDNEDLFQIVLDPSKSLFHLFYCQEEKKIHFLLVVHHGIADAGSAMMLVEDFGSFLLGLDHSQTPLPVPGPIEDHFDFIPNQEESEKYAKDFQKSLRAIKPISLILNHPDIAYDKLKARCQTFCVQGKRMQNIIAFAKSKSLSINAVITALLIESLSISGPICVGAAVDLRRRIKHSTSSLITAPVGAFVILEVLPSDDIESLARRYHEKLHALIHSKDLLLQHYAIIRGKLNPMDFGMSFFFSNAGRVAFSHELTKRTEYLSFHARVIINCPYIACVTCSGKMFFSYSFPDPWIEESLVERMMSSIQERNLS